MRKALKLMAVLAAFGLTAWIGVVALAQGSSAPTPSTATTTTGPSGGDDVKGNCDEAEHANDPECLGVIPVPEDNHENGDQGDVNDDDQGENENNDDLGENEGNDDQGEDMNDDHGDVNDDDQGENENNDDQGENDGNDDQGEDMNDDHGDNSGPGSSNSGPGSSNSGDGS